MEMDTTRRGNYESGADYVLEYGELRFTFNERDFTERVEQAAIRLGVRRRAARGPGARGPRQPGRQRRGLRARLRARRAHQRPAGRASTRPSDRSLVHWLRRLVFRGAWLDQRVKEGELELVFDDRTHTFGYAQPDRDYEVIELSPEPSWREVAYKR